MRTRRKVGLAAFGATFPVQRGLHGCILGGVWKLALLGLRLESGKGPVEMLVLEHIGKPTEN